MAPGREGRRPLEGDPWQVQLINGSAALGSFLVVSLALCLLSVVVKLRRFGGSKTAPSGRGQFQSTRHRITNPIDAVLPLGS